MTTPIAPTAVPTASHITVDGTLDNVLLNIAMEKQPDLSVLALREAMEKDTAAIMSEMNCSLDEAVGQAKENTHAALREIAYNSDDAPWAGNEALRDKLEDAGWRYAALIGIVDSEDESVLTADRAKYPHFMKRTDQGAAIWDERDAIQFVQEVTCQDANVCKRWLAFDWP